jgi:putative Holliday junction resolvase
MRVMAFDYGTKRIGIAVTDPMQIIATGLDTIHPKLIIDFLKKYLQTEPVERFIVGEPKQMDNTPSQSAPHVKGFVNLLKADLPRDPYRNAGRTVYFKDGYSSHIGKRQE